MSVQENNLHSLNQSTCSRAIPIAGAIATALVAAALVTIGTLGQFHVISGLNTLTNWSSISFGISLELLIAGVVLWKCKKGEVEKRGPKGFLKSPYSLGATLRFLANHITNGRFSYVNPDRQNMKLLNKEGTVTIEEGKPFEKIKVLFLGDIMVSKSGKFPQIDEGMKKLLGTAHLIVANVEAPVVQKTEKTTRGLSLKFEMNASYLSDLYACNPNAKWVFSIANNHAFDTSNRDEEDVSGLTTTIKSIKAAIPNAAIVGVDLGSAKPVVSLETKNHSKIEIMAWTEVMNDDRRHYKKEVLREDDIEESLAQINSKEGFLIGFPHGNEEQSYYPLKETRDRWLRFMGKKFDVIVGHGPHVVHPGELVENQGILFHSIGNFCSPVGGPQTKIGCLPEIDFCFNEKGKPLKMHYKVHLLEQHQETVSLLENIEENATHYPKIIFRLRNIWSTLFR